jgi:diaminopimelate epimerase
MQVEFYKYQGTGNDFVIVDNRKGQYSELRTEQIAHLCHRRFGIGADGLMMLENEDGFDFKMKYYNADGQEGSMCGNGGRCLSAFALQQGIQKPSLHFIASDGPHVAQLASDGWIELQMKNVDSVEKSANFSYLNTGSPHYVAQVSDIENFPVYEQGKAIRNNERFKAVGTNVNFVESQNGVLYVRTYERGVEDETYSCGTGVTAAALAMHDGSFGNKEVPIQTLGGQLRIKFTYTAEGTFQNVWLCGPAELVYQGKMKL